ncbi:MAG: hypothetical protein QN141_13415 [Armatimonadota bacterium]|nr:hypothetical protein [Armatimonadota bacterium]MDR7559475.1 hypothetical protein [Armatimonadota bacterium]
MSEVGRPSVRPKQPCPECGGEYSALADHRRRYHGVRQRRPRLLGEVIQIGEPTAVTVRVMSAKAAREVIVYGLPMADVVDLISSTLRQHMTRR